VLSGAPTNVPVAAETRSRILKIVADLGYTPNPVARALRNARTGLLGLIVRDINDPFFSVAVAAMTAEARRHGYSVVLGHVDSSADEALALSEALAMGHCEGAILLGDLRDQTTFWLEAAGRGMPFVGVWQGSRAPQMPVVNVDNYAGMRLAVEHVVELGHRRIAFVQGGRTGDGLERRDACKAALGEHGIDLPERYVHVVTNEFAAAAAAVESLLRRRPTPTAILASTDVAAVGALKAATRCGMRVPQDVSIVGFDDIPLSQVTVPSLTTVHQPLQELSRLALGQLLQLLAHSGEPPPGTAHIAPTLVVRDSTAPLQASVRKR
jgi:LacI family transcriptional regulator